MKQRVPMILRLVRPVVLAIVAVVLIEVLLPLALAAEAGQAG
ncbi:MAG: hypothetical protein ACYDCI_15290 [Candidatus Limnocylindrales bacterium]